ncbi:MAG: helix-turn-helix domain-containing protein [Candidatus Pacebacteria bacterium]|nr:helix-turn-helix domain-containing protein [Candidatus Paceibacterota bacterium]
MNKDKKLPELVTLKEASEILKCHPNTLRQWDEKGILKAIRIGRRKDRRYKKEDIFKFLEKNS